MGFRRDDSMNDLHLANDTVKSVEGPWLLSLRREKMGDVGQECVNFVLKG
jgi:hypothetical protein